MIFEQARKIRSLVRRTGSSGISMHHRLLSFLTILVTTLLLFIFLILLLIGTFTADLRKAEALYSKAFDDIAAEVAGEYGAISASAVGLSQTLSQSMEQFLSDNGLDFANLPEFPQLLEPLLDREFDRLLNALEKTGTSGAFILLDATVTDGASGADFSRAGLYLKNMEPNAVSSAAPTITLLRGFPDIARRRSYALHAQWDLELTINQPPFFFRPLEKAKEAPRPLSRLYYWSTAMTMPQTSEEIMICAVPLIDSMGNPFGVCGFEVSAMLFKLKFMPDTTTYRRIFAMLSPGDGSVLNAGEALFSGNYRIFGMADRTEPILLQGRRGGFFTYESPGKTGLVGLHQIVKLYPDDGAFSDQPFTISLLMPGEELDQFLVPLQTRIPLLFLFFLLIGLGISVLISHRYIRPIMAGLAAIDTRDINGIPKTHITEIDKIIEQIREISQDQTLLPDNLFEDFIAKVKKLTPTEKTIFQYYVAGKTNSEILSLMYISLSTFKTHNSHIYSKLGISSRNELLLYVKLIQQCGCFSEIE